MEKSILNNQLHALHDVWVNFSSHQRIQTFNALIQENHPLAEDFFLSLSTLEQAQLILEIAPQNRRAWLRLLAPDDAADVIQKMPYAEHASAVALLDPQTSKEVNALLAYAEDQAGGLMNPQFFRLRPDMSVEESIHYLRRQAKEANEAIYYAYVLDHEQTLLGVVSFRDIFLASPDKSIASIMSNNVICIPENMDQEEIGRLFTIHHLMAIPVVDKKKCMKGIVSVNDIVDVVKEEATEDIQKLGGMTALTQPYFKTNFLSMIKTRAGWLTILFVGEMLTASAMGYFQDEIARAIVLALFIPLIISSGGNSGSQASTLIIRALALKEIRLKDWWRVFFKELAAGLTLGAILGSIGFIRIILWPTKLTLYGTHYAAIAGTVFLSLIGVVLWGVLSGAMLPFLLKRLGFDPATASAPFVATLVDVTGLVIYFSIASLTLSGILL